MAKTFMQMVGEAQQAVPSVSPEEARRRIDEDPNTLVIDVRDESSIRASGTVPGAAAISAGSLLYKADNEVPEEWRDARLADRSRPIPVEPPEPVLRAPAMLVLELPTPAVPTGSRGAAESSPAQAPASNPRSSPDKRQAVGRWKLGMTVILIAALS